MSSTSVEVVIKALDALYNDPDSAAKDQANAWLSEFKKSDEAWATAQLLLFAPEASLEAKLFAAQTFKTKIVYDLAGLPEAQLLPLRDSLLSALRSFATGPRVVLTQLCIALADLSLQLPKELWDDPTTSMIAQFGSDPAMAGALLEFLQVLAEEFTNNLNLVVKSEFGRGPDVDKEGKLIKRGSQLVELLGMYVQAPGISSALHSQCFVCLGSWLRAGQTTASTVSGSAVLASAFSALGSDELFDAAVDLLVDVVHETQEIEDNVEVIQSLVPNLIAFHAALRSPAVKEDEDKFRGYTRILVEAGEWYAPLIVSHPDAFTPLVHAIAECAAYEELEVVGITLNFWYRLAKALRGHRDDPATQPLRQIFSDLVSTIITHLQYPKDDSTPLVGEERETFRNFRHTIGDTLKDCCAVLGAPACLQQSYNLIAAALSSPATRWQEVEAPLFSMRSMGAEVDPTDNQIMPQIMDLLPRVPAHPKIRYAAILVIGRYTQWIERHPEYIAFQLPYIISGFEDNDAEVAAAAAQSMKYLCKDCPTHLVAHIPDLHAFLTTVSPKLGAEDLLDLAEAIAYIIAIMPGAEQPAALQMFCQPNVQLVHALASQTTTPTKQEIRLGCDALERLACYLAIVGRFEHGLPASCAGTCQQVWAVIDALLVKFGGNALVAEKACVAINRGLQFFDADAYAVAPLVLERLAASFELTPASSYLWITGKMVEMFCRRGEDQVEAVVKGVFERQSAKLFGLLQTTPPTQVQDVLEDYAHLLFNVTEYAPDVVFLSGALPSAFQAVLSSLTLLAPHILLAALDCLRGFVGHDSLQFDPADPSLSPHQRQNFPAYAAGLRQVISGSATQLVSILVDILVDGHEDASSNALTIFRLLAIMFPEELAHAVIPALDQLPARIATQPEKQEFIAKFSPAIAARNPTQVKDSFVFLLRTSRRSRERQRATDDGAW